MLGLSEISSIVEFIQPISFAYNSLDYLLYLPLHISHKVLFSAIYYITTYLLMIN